MVKYFLLITGLVTIKILLFNSTPSTDFEVHRNWMAITNSLPISEWYLDHNSPYHMDYPPIFQYIEWGFGKIGSLFDSQMVSRERFFYKSNETLIYMRITVIVGEFLYWYSLYLLINALKKKVFIEDEYDEFNIFALITVNSSMLFTDNIHFFYGSFFLSFLFFTYYFLLKKQYIVASLIYTTLINMKHIYICCSPALFIIIFRGYCLEKKDEHFKLNFKYLIKIVISIIGVFLISLGPFILTGQANAIFDQLFATGRGLLHTYWAGNIWALYALADKIINSFMYFFTGINNPNNNTALGLVAPTTFAYLPEIKLKYALILAIIFLIPLFYKGLKMKSSKRIGIFICYSTLVYFNFGFQVHEKALFPISIILCFYLTDSFNIAKLIMLAKISCSISCIPLFNSIQLLFLIIELCIFAVIVLRKYQEADQLKWFLKTMKISLLSTFLIIVFTLSSGRFLFMRDMLISSGCAILNQYIFIQVMFLVLAPKEERKIRHNLIKGQNELHKKD